MMSPPSDSLRAFYPRALWFFQRQWIVGVLLFFIDAPHGRFSPSNESKSKLFLESLTVDGTLSWIGMELPSPACLLYSYLNAPLSRFKEPAQLWHPATLLVGLYVAHYINRAVVSPIRTQSRSRPHIIIPLISIAFNLLNGILIGSWLSSGVIEHDGWQRWQFWAGIGIFLAGFAGNVLHDEVLIQIRRKAFKKAEKEGLDDVKPKYEIPRGYLFRFISYPNYLCEWIEWSGFALAASAASHWKDGFARSPPWLFVAGEVAFMFPRALRGHQWYQKRFKDYPEERKAVIPYIL